MIRSLVPARSMVTAASSLCTTPEPGLRRHVFDATDFVGHASSNKPFCVPTPSGRLSEMELSRFHL